MKYSDDPEFRTRMFECSPMPIVVMDAATYKYIDCNPAAARIYKFASPETVIGKNPMDFSALLQYDRTPSPEKAKYYIQKALQDGSVVFEWLHKRPDGETWDAEVHLMAFHYESAQLLQFSLLDITARKQAEAALRESEERYRKAEQLGRVGNWELHLQDNEFWGSDESKRIFGFDTTTQRFSFEATMECVVEKEIVNQANHDLIEGKKPFNIIHGIIPLGTNEKRIMHSVAELVRDENGKPLKIAGVLQDITENVRAEEALRNVQKLESLGVLAGGIAHDFNNLMGGIYGYIDMACETSTDETVSRYLQKAMSTIERARDLTLQLLTFAKGGVPVKKTGSLIPVVHETAQFALSGSNVSCDFDMAPDLSPCDFDKNQIGQVIDNIVINAKQAMPNGGKIGVKARNIGIAEGEHPPLTAGSYIAIAIHDTGIGIPENILPRIFDPFYTTKSTGHGLGLATCFSIINRHGGSIEVKSVPGEGSTFTIFLPASANSAVNDREQQTLTHRGFGTFLIMDDQDVLRDSISDMLESLGYTVICKGNGVDAIDFASAEKTAGRKITGMMFDLTIPGGMGGEEAVREVRKQYPDTPIFVTSGYAEDTVMANPDHYGFTASIRKPFVKSDLSRMLNKYL